MFLSEMFTTIGWIAMKFGTHMHFPLCFLITLMIPSLSLYRHHQVKNVIIKKTCKTNNIPSASAVVCV